ncbi:hypothetical protein V5N11_029180 [Cardamine amara subsp. amara]|uniref:Uncharacterized protein n=1 Tax=Cardamine amara subsp. amara TaxID=228776 RepID=A0ABD1BC34_CARAN
MKDFQEVVSNCSIMDLAYRGPKITWTNRQKHNPISKKLDRALISDSWPSKFPNAYAIFEAGGSSDHARCQISLDSQPALSQKPFKFFNVLTLLEGFISTVAEFWTETEPLFISKTALYRFSRKLKGLKHQLRSVNRDKLGILPHRTKEAFDTLCVKQDTALHSPFSVSFAEEINTSNRWHAMAILEEAFLKQKSKIHWLAVGDQNNKYFHRVSQARRSRNAIRVIQNVSGENIFSVEGIKKEAESWFKGFLQQGSSDFEAPSMNSLQELLDYRCSEEMHQIPLKPVLPKEIKNVLFALPAKKSS